MSVEYEAKWLEIDPSDFRQRLERAGAGLEQSERLMRRNNYDEPSTFSVYGHGWIRVRDEGERVTMTYKKLQDRTITGTIDISIVVDDFARACQLLEAMGLKSRCYQETKRETWRLDTAEVTIDTWPWIPPFVEIEAPDEATVWKVAELLGLPRDRALHGSVENVYQKYFDVTEEDVDNWPTMTFVPVPDWLEKKRRT